MNFKSKQYSRQIVGAQLLPFVYYYCCYHDDNNDDDGDGVAQSQEQFVRVFPSHKCDDSSVCVTPVCKHMHKNDHAHTLKKIL